MTWVSVRVTVRASSRVTDPFARPCMYCQLPSSESHCEKFDFCSGLIFILIDCKMNLISVHIYMTAFVPILRIRTRTQSVVITTLGGFFFDTTSGIRA
jgi:hypothetical protein